MNLYYQDDLISLYHGDCLEVSAWMSADVLVTDPPYGISWSIGTRHAPGETDVAGKRSTLKGRAHAGIANDTNTDARDSVLAKWGRSKPALVFGSPKLPAPPHTRKVLVWQKSEDAGVVGNIGGWRSDWEAIYLLGKWPAHQQGRRLRSSVIRLNASTTQDAKDTGHPHTKSLAGMEYLITHAPPGVIADHFAGSGSTLVAAKAFGRRAIGVELEEKYCRLIASRLAQGALNFGEAS